MYGGSDMSGLFHSTDLWHIKVNQDHVLYEKVMYETKGTAYMISWRTGFTMEYIRGFNDPYLIGGTYGNNQQIQTLFSIPEKECSNIDDFMTTTCSPCPPGNDCKWCEKYEFFEEDYNDYFKSSCVSCPRGLIGGTFKNCIPCEAGYIFTPESETHCKQCSDDKICPLGTKFEFDKEEFFAEMQELNINNVPDIFETNNTTFSRIPSIIILVLLFLTFVSIIIIAFLLYLCKERYMFIFRELDMTPITGGKRRKVIGGILMMFFSMYIMIIWTGFIIDFSIYNKRRETSETSNPLLQKELQSSYNIEIEAYCSKVKESNLLIKINETVNNKYESNFNNLCDKSKIEVHDSYYFKSAELHDIKCTRIRLNDLTDKYIINLEYSEVPKSEIKNQFVSIKLNSDYTQVFHFFRWRFKSIWEKYNNDSISWSELEGIITPQSITDINKNITSGFKGTIPTVVYFSLIPTHYVDESVGLIYKGYRVNLSKFERGSTVNKRTITEQYIGADEPSEGFQVQFIVNTSPTLYQVRVQKVKSFIEVIAYMLGFLAGFVLLIRAIKHYLLKDTYFSNLEKECDKLFGRHQEAKFEDDDEDISDISLQKLERSRIRVMDTSGEIKEEVKYFDEDIEDNERTVQLDKTKHEK